MTEEEMMQIYAVLQMAPGKTPAQRLKFLENIGIDLFNPRQQFFEEQFIGEPEPELVNPVAAAYGRDPAWQNIFGKIQSGMDPDSAVAAAIKEEVIPDPNTAGVGDKRNNPYDIARQYAFKRAENKAAYNQWASRNQNEAAVFGERQNRLRSQFEAEQPYGFEDLLGQSAFEFAGSPTVEDVVADRQRRMLEKDQKRGQMRGTGRFVGSPGSGRVGETKELVRRADPLAKSEAAQKAYLDVVGQRLEGLKQQRVPTERTNEVMRKLAMMGMFGD